MWTLQVICTVYLGNIKHWNTKHWKLKNIVNETFILGEVFPWADVPSTSEMFLSVLLFFRGNKIRLVWIELGFWSAVVFWCYHGKRCVLATFHLPFQKRRKLLCISVHLPDEPWSLEQGVSWQLTPGWDWPGAWLAATSLAFWRESLPVHQSCPLVGLKGHVGHSGLKEPDLELKCVLLLKDDPCHTTQRYWEKNRFVLHPWVQVPGMFLFLHYMKKYSNK